MTPAERSTRWALVTLAALALLYTVHLARDVLLPITLALVFALLLEPARGFLERLRLPRPLASMVLVAALLAMLGGATYLLSSSALDWIYRLPEASERFARISDSVQQEVAEVDLATREVVAMATEITADDSANLQRVVVTGESWQTEFWQAMSEGVVYGGLSVVLLFFLLSSSDQLIKRIIEALPNREDRARALRATMEVQGQMSRYLTTATLVNLAFGTAVGAVLWLVDFPDPALWGAAAAGLRFVPFIGAWGNAVLLAMVAIVSFDEVWIAVAVPAGFLVFSSMVGQFVDPFIYGIRFRLNPIIVFLWIFFWGWLWGVPGVLLAVPLLVMFQVICQHVAMLSPVALLIGGPGATSPDADE